MFAALLASCQTVPEVAPVRRARPETLAVLRASPLQQFLREAPGTTRSGIARLVTLVQLEQGRADRLPDAVARAFLPERFEQEAGVLLEAALTAEDIAALGDAYGDEDVREVIAAALAEGPEGEEVAAFVADPQALTDARRVLVKELMEVSWSPLVTDRLIRAPVATAGRVVAAALPEQDRGARDDLLRIGDSAPPVNVKGLVTAFAFLWRALPDETLQAARDRLAAPPVAQGTSAIIDAAVAALAVLATEVEAAVAR